MQPSGNPRKSGKIIGDQKISLKWGSIVVINDPRKNFYNTSNFPHFLIFSLGNTLEKRAGNSNHCKKYALSSHSNIFSHLDFIVIIRHERSRQKYYKTYTYYNSIIKFRCHSRIKVFKACLYEQMESKSDFESECRALLKFWSVLSQGKIRY